MNKLNKEQQSVVDSNSSKILVLAGAGAGKTHTMLERIDRLVKEGTPATRILVLTFTNAAAFEMRERYKSTHTNQKVPEFRTFHSFCYYLLIKDPSIRNWLNYSEIPTVASDSTIKRIEKEAKLQCNMTLPEDKINGKSPCTPAEQQQIEIYKKAFRRLLKKDNLITFDILASEVSSLFIEDVGCIVKYKKQYRYIFVDEFQDTDPNQIRFLNSFKSANFCFIGDCLQNIYSFRGCTNDTIKLLAKDDSWERIRLFQNYRSTNQICEFANRMSTYADKEYRIEMKGQRDGDKVEVISGARSDWKHIVDEYHCYELLDRLKARKDDAHDVAILCRTNKEVRYICDMLKENEIMFSSGKRNEDALHILKSVSDNEYMLDWLSSFLTTDKYAEYIRLASQEENPDIFWFSEEYGQVPDINVRGKAIVEIRKILRSDKIVISKVADILKVLGIKTGVIESIDSDDNIISGLIEIIESQGDQDIYVGTIHSAKGLEYDTVYVMGVNDHSFQLRSEDMNNLYYVALTRAKNHLVVFKR